MFTVISCIISFFYAYFLDFFVTPYSLISFCTHFLLSISCSWFAIPSSIWLLFLLHNNRWQPWKLKWSIWWLRLMLIVKTCRNSWWKHKLTRSPWLKFRKHCTSFSYLFASIKYCRFYNSFASLVEELVYSACALMFFVYMLLVKL